MIEATKPQAITDYYGENVFSLKVMREYLSPKAYKSISETIKNAGKLDPSIADEVAEAMLKWAVSKGATHFTHWFQPLTGLTAEKHDSFIEPDGEGSCLVEFSAKELIQGEPDASSFPSGGLRPTFEARGYTGWDPTSPAFIKEGPKSATLCIPTYFVGWNGEALDKKTPLLRSMKALAKQVNRLATLLGIEKKQQPYSTLGGEQEYFLIDRPYYLQRIDLVQTGRTLFGKEPAKHQQMADHYFGPIKTRIMAFMEDLDREMWKFAAPTTTRHNEVSPAQFEVAPVFENQNLAVDHNMLLMEVMQKVAEKNGLACLLHEKPFAGVNGSGKHNNWSITGPDGKNWLSPGDNPHENERFLIMLCAVIKAVDTYAAMLRAAVASAANDHRLGSHEAPPAIISIYLGEQLTDIIEQIEKSSTAKSSKQGGSLEVGVDSLPTLPRHASDRNRTSPFAFTGSKFEFRAVGSSMSLAGPNVVLNTIVADSLDEICTQLEADKKAKKSIDKAAQKILQDIIKKHKRVIFNGDNYTESWLKEAKKRGLPNMITTPEALETLKDPKIIKLFERHNVLSKRELDSRYGVYTETYKTILNYEAKLMVDMARTLIIPACVGYQEELAETIKSVEGINKTKATASRKVLKEISGLVEKAFASADSLEKASSGSSTEKIKDEMVELRDTVDALEGLVAKKVWPLPSYAEMLFVLK
ncbi:MAG TPA: glutamine synthetase III [Candidatus Omnitrophota bacterium]|nr:glutamine synthetase III [Candidatus Omnitrophota bacterium]